MTDAEIDAFEVEQPILVAEIRRLKGLIKWAEGTPHRAHGCCLWCGHDVNGEYAINHRGDCMAFERDGTPR